MVEDLRSAVDWDSLRTEVFCPVKHGGESVEHKADYYLRADCAHCDYLMVSPRCERTVSVLMKQAHRDFRVKCVRCGKRTPAAQFYSVVGEVNK